MVPEDSLTPFYVDEEVKNSSLRCTVFSYFMHRSISSLPSFLSFTGFFVSCSKVYILFIIKSVSMQNKEVMFTGYVSSLWFDCIL